MRLSKLVNLPDVKIILYVLENSEVRYSQLSKLFNSKGTLTNAFKELDEEGLIQRRIEQTRPVQAFYSLTKKGKEVATELSKIKRAIES